ncbi:uncharacterized protein LOC113552466 [Rhopalosiphum maidis]|uniref:uncharacterized protein LOC113552466 n=1 Tax=Rhopalosiphum maidis TaxID=43146 RepID=UPI000EFE145E|nr:uncharacterized protein LOC113552466 [Rhopalosiphum maidis]
MKSRTECSPRIIKRTNIKAQTDDAIKYGFYRQINHLSIVRLDNETDKLNYSSWLTRLDNENSALKMHLIKILFISLRSDRSFQMFLKPPPDDLNDLELNSDNTMDMIKYLQDNNIADEPLINEDNPEEIKHKRSAAVATDMRSYTTIKTSPYFVQSFYVRSDFPIYTWYNPTSIKLPSSFDHNQWELYLNRFQILTESKQFNSKHRNECDDIIPIDQISKEVATAFSWHPYSILSNEVNRPKRTPGYIEIDVNIANQQCNQQQIDDAAFAVVYCKVFPGNKILDPKLYSITLIPDAKFIYKMTGVTLVDYSNLKSKKEDPQPNACKLKQRKRIPKNSCEVNDGTLSLPEQRSSPTRTVTSGLTCSDMSATQHHQSAGCNDNRFNASAANCNPVVITEDRPRTLTSERAINNCPAVMRARSPPSTPLPPLSIPSPPSPPSLPSPPSPPSPSHSLLPSPPPSTPSHSSLPSPPSPSQSTPSPPSPPSPINEYRASAADWNPDVPTYSAFSDRRITEDQSRFMTSERIVNDRPAVMCAPPSPPSAPSPPPPANDFRADNADLSDSSSGTPSYYSGQSGQFRRCGRSIMQTGDHNRSESLSTLTSDDSSVNHNTVGLVGSRSPHRHVNYDRRINNMMREMMNDSDYQFEPENTNNSHDYSFQDDFYRSPNTDAVVWPPPYDSVSDVSMPGPAIIGPWSLSNHTSRSDRVMENDVSRISDRYDTSCSEDDVASGQDDYDDRPDVPHNSFE